MRSFSGLGGLKSDSAPILIAEACENHLGSLEVARDMVFKAKHSGAQYVKFQHHLRDFEMIPGLKMSSNFDEDLYDFLGRCSLSISDHVELKSYCDEIGIGYLCTPFCLEAAAELLEHALVDTVKIGSGELLDFRMISFLVEHNISLILSTGMSTFSEISKSVEFLTARSASFALLHCVSEYPPKYSDVCLDSITTLMNMYPDLVIGFSCHTPDIYTALASVSLGAKIIEKHVILDKSVSCPDQSVSISFEELSCLADGIQKIHTSLGIREGVHDLELDIRSWARRVCVVTKHISKGDFFTHENLTTMRAGDGLSSEYYFDLIGNTATTEHKKNTILPSNFLNFK